MKFCWISAYLDQSYENQDFARGIVHTLGSQWCHLLFGLSRRFRGHRLALVGVVKAMDGIAGHAEGTGRNMSRVTCLAPTARRRRRRPPPCLSLVSLGCSPAYS